MSKRQFLPWTHEDHMKRALNRRNLSYDLINSTKIETIIRKVHVGDKVLTPKGIGKVYIIDEYDTICVDIDHSGILYEFERHEVSLYKSKKKKKR